MERRLAAIVCADVAGYSRMMGADEAGTHAAFKAHRAAVHPIILNHGGRIVKMTGDGFLMEFPSIVGAIEAAVAMQVLMAERNAHLPAERMMQFRLGGHMGDVIADEDELFGDSVNIAVRLEGAAAPGGVAISAKAHQEASRHLSVVFADAGSFRFKNIEGTVNVWAWKPDGADKSHESRLASSLAAQYRTAIVGVLPFANLSDSSDDYFSDGLAEDLIHALSLQSFFRVLSRSSTFAFKDKALSARIIAREIDAAYLIQGSVRRAGSKIRVTAELIVPENGEQLWAGRYDRDIGDLFAVQDDITANLCAALVPEIYRAEASVPVLRSPTTDITAWDRFLRGLSHYYQPTKADYEKSIALFREAIALDPALAIARPYLATILLQGIQFGWIRSTQELWAEAKDLAEAGVRLDPRSCFAYSLLSYVHAMDGNHEVAMAAARKAVELNPYDMGAQGVLGTCHFVIGEHREAIELFSSAAQRGNSDPRYQFAVLNAFSHYLLRQYDASLSWAHEALYANPNHLQVLTVRAAALAQLGRNHEARQATETLLGLYPGLTAERHLKNFRWKLPEDVAHYREGLLKAGVPPTRLTLVDLTAKRAGECGG
jgi:adenylate cyclase